MRHRASRRCWTTKPVVARDGRDDPERRRSVVHRAAQPGLRAPKDWQADVAAYHELLAALDESHTRPVGLSVLRIEDLAATPLIAIRPHVPENLHADDWLAVPFAGTFAADAVFGICRDEQRVDDTDQLVADLADLDHCRWFPIPVADGVPEADRRRLRARDST